MKHAYVEESRPGDHICYYSDLRKMKSHYPCWTVTKSLEQTIGEIVESWRRRISRP
jgi:CDP-paratose 2-epimerase